MGSWDHGGYGYRHPRHHAQHPLTPLPYHQHIPYYPDHPASSGPLLGHGYQHPQHAPSRDSEEERTWRKHHHLLHQFLLQFGHCDVPPGYGVGTHYATLRDWIAEQRVERSRMRDRGRPSTMTPTREAALSAMGLAWDADDDGPPGAPPPMPPSSSTRSSSTRSSPGPPHDTKTWEERFAELRAFREETGHANIPKSYGPNPGLGRWAAEQRGQHKRMLRGRPSTLTPDRADQLTSLGFKWSVREGSTASWENWLIELRRYRSEHGNIDVPLKYPGNPALGAFVNRQRTEYRKLHQGLQTSLNEERIDDLNELGFKWAIRVSRTPWDTRLEELRQFKEGEKSRDESCFPPWPIEDSLPWRSLFQHNCLSFCHDLYLSISASLSIYLFLNPKSTATATSLPLTLRTSPWPTGSSSRGDSTASTGGRNGSCPGRRRRCAT